MARQVIYDRGGAVSTINGLLKDDEVLSKVQELVNKSTYLLSRIGQKKTTHGRQFVFSVQLGTSEGVGARGENVDLPDPGFGEYEQAMGNTKYIYSTLYITGPAIAAGQGNKAAFADVLKTALRDAREGYKKDIQRQMYGDGSGALGVVETAGTGDTIGVTRPFGLTYVEADLEDSEKTRLFRRNMNLYFAEDDEFAKVVGVNGDGTITLDRSVTVAAGTVIYRGDATNRTSVNNEITGLSGILQATGDYLNLPRDGVPEWQGNLLQLGDGDGGSITEEAMRIAMDTADVNGTGEADLILTTHRVRRAYEGLLTSQKRYVNPMQLEGGYSALEFDGKPLMVDKDAPPQRMWFLNTKDLHWMVMEDLEWMDRDGAVLSRVENRDAYKAVLYTYRELITTHPANQTVLFDVTA